MFTHARYLDQFFEEQLRKWLPSYTIGRTAAHELKCSSSGGGSRTSMAASRSGSGAADAQSFGDGSVVIGSVKRMRTSAPDACD